MSLRVYQRAWARCVPLHSLTLCQLFWLEWLWMLSCLLPLLYPTEGAEKVRHENTDIHTDISMHVYMLAYSAHVGASEYAQANACSANTNLQAPRSDLHNNGSRRETECVYMCARWCWCRCCCRCYCCCTVELKCCKAVGHKVGAPRKQK
jgi:hypothetical protein